MTLRLALRWLAGLSLVLFLLGATSLPAPTCEVHYTLAQNALTLVGLGGLMLVALWQAIGVPREESEKPGTP